MNVAAVFDRLGLSHTTGIVAVSGGPDSVALAHLLGGLLEKGKLQGLIVAHVNHLLRGDESDADEAFVRNRWPTCRTTRIDVGAISATESDNLEGIARRERYRWFTQLAKEEGASWVATGHTADDQAETVLFRILRGSGVLGLGAMQECRPLDDGVLLIRPLLMVRRQAVLDYLHQSQFPFLIDSSNRDPRFARNRLRLQLLPTLEREYNPGVVDVLCRLAQQAQEIHVDLEQQARQLLNEAELSRAANILVFSVDRLQKSSPNLLREMFRLVWQREGWPMGDMDFARWQHLVEIVHGTPPAWDFPGKIHVRRVGRVIQVHFCF